MRITRNLRAISKLSLTLLLLVAFIVGAVISYMFAMGYIVSMGLRLPKNPAITIANVTFSPQDATTFNVSILNPSYSPSTANITQIMAVTDGVSHSTTILYPLSREIKPGSLENFTCSWDWSNHTGERVTVHAFVEGGLGVTLEAKTPFMDFSITDVYFNSTLSTTQFNVTIQNSELSATYVNVTEITVALENETVFTPNLPYGLDRGSSETFMCQWDWTNYRSKDIRITAHTLQGYKTSRGIFTPERVILSITEAIFNVTDSTRFNVTVQSSDLSSTNVDIVKINVATEDLQNVIPSLPYSLHPDSLVQFRCGWNWTNYQGENVTITVYTSQGYTANYTQVVPLLANLSITKVLFDVTDTNHFNITVENLEFSRTHVNITKITITLEDGIAREVNQTEPALIPSYSLLQNTSVMFNCTWDWTNYRGKSVMITVYTAQGYTAFYSEVTPSPVMLTMEVDFNLANATHFTVTVENSKFSIDYVVISKVEVTLWNGTLLRSIDVILTRLFPNDSITLVCSWNWTDFPNQGFTVTAYTLQGYTVESRPGLTTPSWMKLTIEEILFDPIDTLHFNVTVKNSGPSPLPVNITSITVTTENETIQITGVIPELDFRLNFNTSETFKCPWDWTYHRNKTVIITVYTREGHMLYCHEVTSPPVILRIKEVLFVNGNNTAYFNVTVENSIFSLTYDVITDVTVALENGTILETIEVTLVRLYPDSSYTFQCLWDWTGYQGINLTVTVYSLRGYTASAQKTP